MNANHIFSLSVETIAELRARADALEVPYSALADFLLRAGLHMVPMEKMQLWASQRPSKSGSLGGGMNQAERATLAALRELTERNTEGVWRFDPESIAAKCGIRIAEVYGALRKLERRKMVECIDTAPGEVDRWGRPTCTSWNLPR